MTDKNDIDTLLNLYDGMEVFDVPEPDRKTSANNDKNAYQAVIVFQTASDEDRKLLSKILAALSLSENEVFIIPLADTPKPVYSNLLNNYETRNIISFGCSPAQLDLNIRVTKYDPVTVNGAKVLFSDDLARIGKDQMAKKALWNALKVMFELKSQ